MPINQDRHMQALNAAMALLNGLLKSKEIIESYSASIQEGRLEIGAAWTAMEAVCTTPEMLVENYNEIIINLKVDYTYATRNYKRNQKAALAAARRRTLNTKEEC